MNEEYEKGQEIGELRADIKNVADLLREHNRKQDEWNQAMDSRVKVAEAWIQTTTGKVVVLTAIFSFVGAVAYIAINWFINRFK